MFKHLPDATLQDAPTQEVAATATQPNQPTSEMDELKAIILTLVKQGTGQMKQGAEQKALITATNVH